MKRVLTVVLAALVALSMVGIAGCTKRKSKSKKRHSTSDSAPVRNTPTPARSSPSPSANDPAGKACSEIMEQVKTATAMAWRLDDKQTQATADTTRKGGTRKCYFVVSGTATLPPALLVVTLYRIERRVDNGPDDVRANAEKRAGCTDKLPSPPAGTTLAIQCLERHGGTLFDVQTTLSGQRGYVLAFISMQPNRSSDAVETKARDIGRKTADIALTSL